MKVFKKCISLMLVALLAAGMFTSLKAEAAEIKLAVPKISVSVGKDGTSVKVTIKKTKDADGYEICYSGYGDMYDDYKKIDDQYGVLYTLEKNGKKKRTVTIKSLIPGTYKIAVRSYNEKKYGTLMKSDLSKATKVTIAESGYKDSYDFSKLKKGDTFKFGSYMQRNSTNVKEPIEWVVLSKNKSQMLVVSKYALDYLPYHKTGGSITWENCTLRSWLNDKFYNAAFNKAEKDLIKTTTVENLDNAVHGTTAGNNTKDKIFLLSLYEVIETDYGFAEDYATYDENRRCGATAYAVAMGLSTYDSYKIKYGDAAYSWLLRSPGYGAYSAANVDNRDGCVGTFGDNVSHYGGVRPALIINLK